MLQDIAPQKLDNTYLPEAQPMQNSVIFLFRNHKALVRSGEGKLFPTYEEIGYPSNTIYLFTIGKISFFLLQNIDDAPIPTGFVFETIRNIRYKRIAAPASFFAFYTALHLAEWYQMNRYCGACGAPMRLEREERSLCCPRCNAVVYPRINPAVIVGVLHEGKILLTKYADERGISFALVAGFTEIGETFEETAAREVMEEVGLKVKNLRYYKSQPWGSAADILAGFYCDLDGSDSIRLDRDELSRAVWATPDEVILQQDDWSLTNEMMKRFKDGLPC